MKFIIEESYPIKLKSFIFSKVFALETEVSTFEKIDNASQKKIIEEFSLFNIHVKKIILGKFIILRAFPYIEACNLSFYEAINSNNEIIFIMEILDIGVEKKYRDKGIGTQIMHILIELSLKNKVKYIIGELQEERENEPLEGRINFFQKNGFSVWEEKKSRFSGWIAKKEVSRI